jgi:1,4-alpha-glucan branching enzyme
MKRLLLFVFPVVSAFFAQGQLLTWTPSFPTENSGIEITADATKGNQGLLNYTGDVYVHIGVITNKSANSSDWKYVPFTWATTPANGKATSLGNNKWKYTISNIRTFFGITDPAETIRYIAILFRNSDGSKVQRNADGSDMYIPVYSSSELAVRFTSPAREPKFVPVPETQNWPVGTNFTFSADASQASTLKLYHNGTLIATANNATTISGNSTVTAAGNQQLIAEATAGGVTKYDTLNIFVSGTTSVANLPTGVRDGINYWPGTDSVTLVLRAPGKSLVTVIGDFNNWTQDAQYTMKKTPDGKFFWITIKGLTAGTEYAFQYVVDGTLRIADPYSEKILDPDNDQYISSTTYPNLKPYPTGKTTGIVGVLQPAQTAYNWTVNNFNRPDKRGLVIYELLVRDFVAAHDWKTVQDSLNYLQRLGVNAIELMPFNEFEGNSSWGYNPDFYFTPDKYYGPASTLKQFIDSCHRRGIAVIMDIALNHQFGSSPMVQLYWDAVNNRPAANSPWFNPVPKHAFNVGYDMNHESPDTKYFVGRVTEYWLQQYKLDGFRFDLAKGFTQKQTCDASGNNCDVAAWSAYDASRVAIWKGYYDTVQNKSANAYVILEHFADNTEETELSNYGMMLWGNLNYNYSQASISNPAGWDFSNGIYSVRGWSKPYLVTYAESHDEERIVYQNLTSGYSTSSYNIRDTTTALKRAELVSAFLLTIPGPKMIWQFGELGYDYSINTCTNGTVNNNCRLDPKPIRWDYLNDPRRTSIFNVYSKLNKLRFHPWYTGAFQTGSVDKSLNNAFKWIKVTTSGDTSDLIVIGNFDIGSQSGSVTFPTAGTWYDYLNNTVFTSTGTAQTFTLGPGEYRVYVNRNVNNNATTPVSNVPWNGTTLAVNVYPNPVRSAYTIELALPQSGTTTITLFNSMGQYISTIYNGFLQKGERQLPLQRPAAATGTYYLKLQTKTEIKTIPITLQ